MRTFPPVHTHVRRKVALRRKRLAAPLPRTRVWSITCVYACELSGCLSRRTTCHTPPTGTGTDDHLCETAYGALTRVAQRTLCHTPPTGTDTAARQCAHEGVSSASAFPRMPGRIPPMDMRADERLYESVCASRGCPSMKTSCHTSTGKETGDRSCVNACARLRRIAV